MKIRIYQPTDLKGLELLEKEFHEYTKKTYPAQVKKFTIAIKSSEKEYIRSYIKELLSLKNSRFLVAEDKGKIVGYIVGNILKNRYEKDKLRGHIESLFVTESYRKNKLGKELYLKLTEWFRKKGCTQLILETAEGNPTIKIYEKWGFQKTRQEMRKKL